MCAKAWRHEAWGASRVLQEVWDAGVREREEISWS